jgi:4-hydroxy-3-polyprenylbenzoate decarboxylase
VSINFVSDRLLYSPDVSAKSLQNRARRLTVVRELALLVSGGSGSVLAARFAVAALASEQVDVLHVVVSGGATKVLAHELGPEWASAKGFRDNLSLDDESRARIRTYTDSDLAAPIASGSHLLHGVIVLPCSAGMAGSLANGISRGLAQRVADVALKQRWPLLIGIRETPMSAILLNNLLVLARAGAHIVPPLPAFYLKPDESTAQRLFVEHYCLRLLDLLAIPAEDDGLRWQG